LGTFLHEAMDWCLIEAGMLSQQHHWFETSTRQMHESLQRMLQATPSKTHEHITPFLDAIITSSRNNPNASAPNSIITKYFWTVDEAISLFTYLDKDPDGWITEKAKNGVSMMKRVEKQEGRGSFETIKLSIDIELGSQLVHNYLRDASDWKRWYSSLEEVKIVEQLDKNTDILYTVFSSNQNAKTSQKISRDFCVVRHWFQKSDACYLHVARSVLHDNCPKKSGVTRSNVLCTGFLISPISTKSTKLTYIIQVDVGNIPIAAMEFKQQDVLMNFKKHIMNHRHSSMPF